MSEIPNGRPNFRAADELAGGPCVAHPQNPADFFCDGCGALLCRECARDIGSIQTCRRCGERAVALRQGPDESRNPALSDGPGTGAGDEGLLGLLSHHLVVPAAITAMVAAFLFYLLDIRSVFLGGSAALKQVGFCFAAATVLIARYGKVGGDSERQGCYSAALLGATGLVVVVAPWSPARGGFWELLANLAILLAVWRFAGRLTRRLSIESDTPRTVGEKRLFGVERLRMEAWKRSQQPAPTVAPKPRRPGRFARQRKARVDERDAHGNPAAGVARLALVAMAAFALGEPLLLGAPPEIGERALAAVIVFLLATGVVLAAGSGLGLSRQVRRRGGLPAPGLVPSRIAFAALLTVAMLAAVLAIPGVTYRGSGVALAEAGGGSPLAVGEGRPDGAGQARSGPSPRQAGGESGGSEGRESRSSAGGGAPSALIGHLAELGQWLKWPILILVAVLGALGLVRLYSRLGSGAGLRAWLAALLGRFRRTKAAASGPRADPLAGLAALAGLPPQKAVVDAYGRFLGVVDQLGYSRDPRDTPYDVLRTVNKRFRPLTEPARKLTALYVRAAYSEQVLSDRDRQEAVEALGELGRQIAGRSSASAVS